MGLFTRFKQRADEEAQSLQDMQKQSMMQGQGVDGNGVMDGFKALSAVIGKEQVQKANQTLQKYKEGKPNLAEIQGRQSQP